MAPSFEDGNSLFDFVVRDGNGVKGLVDSGISKVPDQYIQPQQERIDNQNGISHKIPPIDLSKLDGPNHDQVAEEIASAAEKLGFFQVVNHGVPVELLESLKDVAHKFFAQPPEKKAIYCQGVSPSPYVKYGTSFVPEKERALEWKDYINMVYTNDADALNHWPNECKEVALEFLNKSIKMVRKLVEILIGKLGVAVEDSRIDALTGFKMVNMNFYPACPNPDLTVGVGRHSDMGTLTVLLQDGIGGLYVKVEEDIDAGKKGDWIEIPPIPGALVINVGDTLQVVSNGRYKSAEHRVRTTSTQSRVSIPIFTTPKPTEKIGPLPQVVETDGVARYREFAFQEYMNNFFGNAHDGKKSLDFAKLDSA
ncbi:scopoletin 8-hydroxylase [Quercus suber]|uniref:Feruloyl coa ortho-hydroxylase 1 n=1 Tax=Quercus suber TaxID=58331 RepID=A0AAW0KH55_QUESU|nr:feruloyl CoA ortho-hydroxylase 1-like [Quercus suber]POE83697.1 feruloyl coa ortho-hydroxylase 1 [Quercus suber]